MPGPVVAWRHDALAHAHLDRGDKLVFTDGMTYVPGGFQLDYQDSMSAVRASTPAPARWRTPAGGAVVVDLPVEH